MGARETNEEIQKQLDVLKEIVIKLDFIIRLLDGKATPSLENSLKGISKLTIISEEEAEEFDDFHVTHTGTAEHPDYGYNYAQDDLNFDAERERRSK